MPESDNTTHIYIKQQEEPKVDIVVCVCGVYVVYNVVHTLCLWCVCGMCP